MQIQNIMLIPLTNWLVEKVLSWLTLLQTKTQLNQKSLELCGNKKLDYNLTQMKHNSKIGSF